MIDPIDWQRSVDADGQFTDDKIFSPFFFCHRHRIILLQNSKRIRNLMTADGAFWLPFALPANLQRDSCMPSYSSA